MASTYRPFANILAPGVFQVPTGQLEIDWTQPLTNGLIGCWVPGAMGGVDLTQMAPTLIAGSGTVFGGTLEGPGLQTEVVNSGLAATSTTAFTGASAFTIYWRGISTQEASANGCGFVTVTYDNVGTTPFVIWGISYALVLHHIQAVWNSGGTFSSTSSGIAWGLITGSEYSSCATFQPGGNTAVYQNGQLVGTQAFGASGPTSTATSQTQIHLDPTRIIHATCNICAMWNRVLSAAEIAAMDNEPYGFLISGEYDLLPIFLPPPQFLVQTKYSQAINFTD